MDTSNTTAATTTTTKPMSEENRRRLIDSIPTAPIIDSCKENIQPRKSGRSVAALTTLFESNPQEREHAISLGQARFNEQLDTLDDQDDPLDIYIQHLAWTHQMYPQGNTAIFIELLQNATERFKTDRRYKSDPRYLKIWIEYAQYIEDPLDIYKFLARNEIGQTLALFYEEYAAYYEKKKRYDEATKVLELGIENDADPLRRLQKNFTLFKARIEERKQRGILEKEKQLALEAQLKNTGHRTVLGHKLDGRSRSSMPANVYNGFMDRSSSTAVASGSSSSIGSSRQPMPFNRSRTFGNDTSTTSVSRSSSPGFSIYQDEGDSGVQASDVLPSPKSSTRSNTLHIHQSTKTSKKSENQYIPKEDFNGTTVPQASLPPPQPALFQVYQETEEQVERSPPSTSSEPAVTQPQRGLSFSPGAESTVSKIRKNPTADFISNKRSKSNNNTSSSSSFYNEDITMSSIDTTSSSGGDNGNEALKFRFRLKQHEYKKHVNGKDLIAVSTRCFKHIDNGRSLEEYRAAKYSIPIIKRKEDETKIDFSSYHKQEGLKDEPVPREYTTETLEAQKIVDSVFDEGAAYTEEEQDLTWNNPVQRFKKIERAHVNENDI